MGTGHSLPCASPPEVRTAMALPAPMCALLPQCFGGCAIFLAEKRGKWGKKKTNGGGGWEGRWRQSGTEHSPGVTPPSDTNHCVRP